MTTNRPRNPMGVWEDLNLRRAFMGNEQQVRERASWVILPRGVRVRDDASPSAGPKCVCRAGHNLVPRKSSEGFTIRPLAISLPP